MSLLCNGLKLCLYVFIISHVYKTKSFVRAKALAAGPAANFMQLTSELLNVKNMLENQMSQKNSENSQHPQEVKNWPRRPLEREIPLLGQVSGVAVKANGNPVIFHRGPVEWDSASFDISHRYTHFDRVIGVPPVVELDEKTGAVEKSWGAGIFYLPHSITIDPEGDYWFTDVALHQVIKMKEGEIEPKLSLGEAGVPGSDNCHFCKPTDVAVSSKGIVFVSDGYCNSRIVKYDKNGNHLGSWGENGELFVPHSLTLLESRDRICVADREHKRIVCYEAGLTFPHLTGKEVFEVRDKDMGPVYGLASYGRFIFAVTSPRSYYTKNTQKDALTVDADTGKILDRWAPHMGFNTPHAIAMSPKGDSLYVAQIGEAKVWKFI